MRRIKKPFNLPMTLTHLMTRREDGRCVAHSLDFDIACVDRDEETASRKLSLAIKTYVEFGLSKGWQEFIVFPAPQQLWDSLTTDIHVRLRPPILIANLERKVMEAKIEDRCAA